MPYSLLLYNTEKETKTYFIFISLALLFLGGGDCVLPATIVCLGRVGLGMMGAGCGEEGCDLSGDGAVVVP